MEIAFYHLQNQTLERALPPLIEDWLAQGSRIVVQAGSEERLDALDEALWTYNDASFLPHGRARDGDAEMQPVFLTTDAGNPNGAKLRVLFDGADVTGALGGDYERLILVFDGNDADQLQAARAQWKRLKEQGLALSYWNQGAHGWERRG
ncbi:MAG TPA: DNA polymerase III subunit chi [Methylovirgula sp.]|nr:DNA polymerase III subunit chi [Methylovirgula sp.]